LVKLAQGQYAEAVDFFREELERFGDEYHRLRSLADAYYLWEKAEEACHWYRQAREIVSSEKERILIDARLRICEEPELLRRAVEGARSFERAVAAQKEGSIEDAIAACLRAVEADPTNFMARNNLGSIYLNEKNDPLRARAEFEAALEYSDLPLIHKNLQLCKAKESAV
jgi:tetratricopeptide (TPR) repeat protein